MKRIVLVWSILCASCTSLPELTSVSEKTISQETVYRFYDAESKMRYQISNDQTHLHLKLNTTDRMTITKILKTGLSIYFDKEGKKSRQTYIHYPIPDTELSIETGMQQRHKSFDQMLAETSSEFIFKNATEEKRYHLVMNSGIQLSIDVPQKEELIYDLKIPFDKIDPQGREGLQGLSLGIVSGSFNLPDQGQMENRSQRPAGSQLGGNVGKMSRPGVGKKAAMATPVEIWFQVQLAD